MFPYPSGAGLHVGHPLGYIATDVVGRYRRMRGDNVLHALGYDAFGLPAEQFAVQTGQHPRVTTEANIGEHAPPAAAPRAWATTRAAPSRPSTPDYVRWTQWIFLQIFDSWYDPEAGAARRRHRPRAARSPSCEAELAPRARAPTPDGRPWADLDDVERVDVVDAHRLAYVSETPVNWCPGLGTVLANEEVTVDGRSERGNFPVFQRNLRQWKMRITAYADRLVDDLDLIDWPDKVQAMQRNWIGRSRGRAGARSPSSAGSRGRGLHDAPRHAVRGDLHGRLARAPAARRGARRLAGRHARPPGPAGTRRPSEAVAAYRAEAAAKTAVERAGRRRAQDRRVHRAPGHQPGQRRADPGVHRRLRAHGLRHRRDHGRARLATSATSRSPRPSSLPVIHTVEPPEGFAGGACDRRRPRRSTRPNDEVSPGRPGRRRGQGARSSTGSRPRASARAPRPTACGTGCSAASATGASRSPSSTTSTTCRSRCPTRLLPVELPEVPDYSPRTFDPDDAHSSPEPPLGRNQEWVNVTLDLGDGPQTYRRDTNTMPNWAGSCWYYLRYLDPTRRDVVVDPALERVLDGAGAQRDARASSGGVDLYVGGVEHAVLHLLYARFWHKVLHDLGHVSSVEPFRTSCSTRATSRRTPSSTPAASTSRPPRWSRSDGADGAAAWTLAGPGRHPRVREDGQVAEERRHARRHVRGVRRRHLPRLRDVDGPAGPVPAVGHARRRRLAALPAAAVAQRRRRGHRRARGDRRRPGPSRRCGCCTARSTTSGSRWRRCGSTPRSPSSSCSTTT